MGTITLETWQSFTADQLPPLRKSTSIFDFIIMDARNQTLDVPLGRVYYIKRGDLYEKREVLTSTMYQDICNEEIYLEK